VFAATEVLAKRELPGRPDVGVLSTRLLGHKFERAKEGETLAGEAADAPAGCKKTRIFELERELVVKRRSHYA
jgi:hypothetical protein